MAKTNNGLDAFAFYIPDFNKNNLKKPVRIRNEKTPSAFVKKSKDTGHYIITDFGDDKVGRNIIDFLMVNENITFKDALNKINHDLSLNLQKPEYDAEWKPLELTSYPLSDKIIDWFQNLRSISKYTLLRFGITESIESIYVKKHDKYLERACINFNYIVDDEIINVKYRDGEKNFKLIPKAPLIFYGLDFIQKQKYCVITEGEIDALSYYEAGLKSVCSVPNGGVKKGTNNLKYMDNCWEYFEEMDAIYLALDDDGPGKGLREDLARRLGKERCFIVKYPQGCKDGNETLVKFGADELRFTIENATPYPLDGIERVADYYDDIDKLYDYGYPETTKLGFPIFDKLFGFCMEFGELTILTGTPNSGKTTFLSQVLVRLFKRYGWKAAAFLPESVPFYIYLAKMLQQFVGRTFHKGKANRMSVEEKDYSKSFIDEFMFFIKLQDKNMTVDYILEKARELVKRHGIKILVIDPWNKIEKNRPANMTEMEYISSTLDKLYSFAKLYNVHIIVVAHPTKLKQDTHGNYPIATLKNVSGSADFDNKPDNGISVYRDMESGNIFIHTVKIRIQEFIGKLGLSEFDFDEDTCRYKEVAQRNFESEIGEALIPEEHRTIKVPLNPDRNNKLPDDFINDTQEWDGMPLDILEEDMPF